MEKRPPVGSRRRFLANAGEITAASMLGAHLAARSLPAQEAQTGDGGMPMRTLGQTGEKVSILGVGGGGRGQNPQIRGTPERPEVEQLAERILHRALDAGVNYIDSCTGYGQSERIIGNVAATRRKEMFLATKCDRCAVSGDQLRRELEQSLERLRTDRIDLWQIHNVATLQNVEATFKKDGAVEVFQKAKEEGIARFIGFSVHSSRTVIEAVLDRCRRTGITFDALLMSFNVADRSSGGHGKRILDDHPSIGKIAMKVFASDGAPLIHRQRISAETGLRYVWSHGFATAIIGTHTLEELEENVRIAREFEAYTEAERKEIEKRIATNPGRLWALRA